MYQVVSFGSAVLDIMVKSPELKVLKSHQVEGGVAICEVYGGKAEVEQMLLSTGGGAANTAVSFRRKGLSSALIAKIGGDDIGKMVNSNLEREKVGLDLLVRDAQGQTGTSIILVAPDGGRSILTRRGVAAQLDSRDINWEKLYQCKWFYLSSLGGQMELLEDAINFAHKHNIRLAVNPGKKELEAGTRLKKMLSRVDVLLLNRLELSALLGVEYEDTQALHRGGQRLGANLVVMSEGKDGATAIRSHELIQVDSFKVESVDNTGAGDAFGSGLVYGLIKGYAVRDALKIGAANAASEVSELGVQSGLLTDKQVEKWLKKKLNVVERNLV
jgi:sugar/nucleoside kinase (ribokinase family)